MIWSSMLGSEVGEGWERVVPQRTATRVAGPYYVVSLLLMRIRVKLPISVFHILPLNPNKDPEALTMNAPKNLKALYVSG